MGEESTDYGAMVKSVTAKLPLGIGKNGNVVGEMIPVPGSVA